MARDRGIAITETKHEQPGDYETLIRLSVKTDRRSRSVAGTIFGGNRERIVEIKDIPIEAEWGAHMLYITNKDRPGVIGDLGRMLADNGVNIATFHLGRSGPGDDAIALCRSTMLCRNRGRSTRKPEQYPTGESLGVLTRRHAFVDVVTVLFFVAPLGGVWKPVTVGKVDGLSNIVVSKDGKTAYAVAQGKIFRRDDRRPAKRSVEAPIWPSPPTDMIPYGNVAVGQNHIEKAWLVQPTLRYGHGALGDKIEAGGFKVQLRDGRELVYELGPICL